MCKGRVDSSAVMQGLSVDEVAPLLSQTKPVEMMLKRSLAIIMSR
ncbi:hypothetical protein [Salinimicrobium sp. TH3]|nr:hypothetical protein [Salinimicrobium sp. TH3]MCY2687859.1 hypothetical protein [Salinimicrobium sp. TH3]